ncbi:MAG TPA: hypothetical protein VHZ02_03300 [Acidimicrobiales bacterium]|nr:hypothetical protein [Acidimicrobiales bacterium]
MDKKTSGMVLEVRGAQYGGYVLSFIFDMIGGSDDFVGRGPRVVAVSHTGEEYEIEQFKSMKRAKRALLSMQEELHRLGRVAWCQAHDLPMDFLEDR